MNKVEVGILDRHELFEHRGVQEGLLCPLPIPKRQIPLRGYVGISLYRIQFVDKSQQNMKTLVFDVMLDGRFVHTFRYQYCPLFPIDEQELEKFVTDRLPTLKGKDFKIVF